MDFHLIIMILEQKKFLAITLDQMKEAVKKVLRNESMFTLKVGRLEEKK